MTVTVNAATTNAAPTVSAGPDRVITLPSTATLQGSASDDGKPSPPGAMTLRWTRVSGPGTVTFSAPAAAVTSASFSAPGTYVLQLTASDSVLSRSDSVTVTVKHGRRTSGMSPSTPGSALELQRAYDLVRGQTRCCAQPTSRWSRCARQGRAHRRRSATRFGATRSARAPAASRGRGTSSGGPSA